MRKRDVIRNMIWAWLLVAISVAFTVTAWYSIMVVRALPQ